jgi:hypothetical protein
MTEKKLKKESCFSVIFQQKFNQNSAIDSFFSHFSALSSFLSDFSAASSNFLASRNVTDSSLMVSIGEDGLFCMAFFSLH